MTGLRTPVVKSDCTHVYYDYPLVYDAKLSGVSRSRLIEALSAEGVSVSGGYQNIHLLPIFQKKIAYGSKGFPWRLGNEDSEVDYEKGICPVAEGMNDKQFMSLPVCMYDFSDQDIALTVAAFRKVWANLAVLH